MFVATTIFLFDYPLMQMLAHYFLTMATVVVLANNPRTYETRSQRIVEVGSEFTLHMTSIMMTLFFNPVYDGE